MAALTPDEAQTRAELLDISLYNVHLDLRGAADPEHGTFTSITTISLVAAHTGRPSLTCGPKRSTALCSMAPRWMPDH
ncbi:hypothetical protein [Ornithinimicrobium sp. INDO-MA30-4]|uniref:hypothetical protein n=1 Tax=Ornithinimicrobium sp. INDO-MA30-4 TaxID=2908651 RepID=UPI001F28E8ED|nr:hypothetical protein [Ornithinimicrobium sp. INDO-MA30-4]UJH69475.1 hypothetical protein L0A91_08700 [Ornithinimicrobium sp. INDO-MA30-4]